MVGPAAAALEPPSTPAPLPDGAPTPHAMAWHSMAVVFGTPDPSLRMSQPHLALPALTDAAQADPLQAALDAVYAGVVTFGEDYPALLAEVWSVCRSHS